MLNEKELLKLSNQFIDIDPNLSATILALANCRMADKLLGGIPHPSLEEWLMNLLVVMSSQAENEVNYGKWLVTGGTENETKV